MKVAIAGYGLEGKSNYDYFTRQGHQVVIVDEREIEVPVDASVITGDGAFERLAGFDMVVRTAGLAPRKIKTDGKIWSATNEFFAKCTTPIIGVTGTKGKGTTASLVESMLRAAGKKTLLIGNIGRPALDALEEANVADVVVYEMSSFQLWDLEKSPQVAVVLMIEPDHLDVHADFQEYILAKANIRKYQNENDICFYHPTNQYSRQIAEANGYPNAYPYDNPSDPESVYAREDAFWIGDQKVCGIDALRLPGQHNIENACAAMSAVFQFTDDTSAIERGLRAFSGLDHRLKFVRDVDGVRYYDDSIATTPGSAVAAMRAFTERKILILGGSSKGADFSDVAQTAKESDVLHIIAIGAEAENIEQAFAGTDVPVTNLGENTSMPEVVALARNHADTGDVVILSPACASFGMFKNYKDRGDQFIAAVNNL